MIKLVKKRQIGFYIRGETPRTISQQYLSLQMFCLEYRIPLEDVIILKDITRSDEPRPKLESIISGRQPLDLLVMQSPHILHLYDEESLSLAKLLIERGVSVLYANVNGEAFR